MTETNPKATKATDKKDAPPADVVLEVQSVKITPKTLVITPKEADHG